MGFAIKVVAARTGVSAHTLRAWERRYGVPKPNRGADNRYRLYGADDIADVLWLKQQVESGIPPAQASALLRERRAQPRAAALMESPQQIATTQTALLDAFVESDEAAARHILDEAFALFAPEQVALQIIAPTLREIGERWLRAEMTVWQEHLASNVIRQKILAVLQSQSVPSLAVPYVIAACAPAEEHEAGLLLFTLLARRRGWRVAYLGQRTPLDDITRLARQTNPNVIAISVATIVGLAGLVPWLVAANRPAVPLGFGGRLVNVLPSLRAKLPGVFLGEDAQRGVSNLSVVESRQEYWTPARRVWKAVEALRAERLKIAGGTVARFMAAMPRHWDATPLDFATLFLVDALLAALAFDAPELIDAERAWLAELAASRQVPAELIVKHLDIFARVVAKTLARDQVRVLQPLVERMKIQC